MDHTLPDEFTKTIIMVSVAVHSLSVWQRAIEGILNMALQHGYGIMELTV